MTHMTHSSAHHHLDCVQSARGEKQNCSAPAFFWVEGPFPTWREKGGGERATVCLNEREGDWGKLDWALRVRRKKTAAKIQNAQPKLRQGTDDSGFLYPANGRMRAADRHNAPSLTRRYASHQVRISSVDSTLSNTGFPDGFYGAHAARRGSMRRDSHSKITMTRILHRAFP